MQEKLVEKLEINREELVLSVKKACDWIADTAQIQTDELTIEKNSKGHRYKSWKGAIRGEYSAATGEWDFFCPIWHTGQAIKALVAAHRILGDAKLIASAKLAAQFIGNARIDTAGDPHYGLILATENSGTHVNTSAVLECIDGLWALAELTGDEMYGIWAEDAVKWVFKNAYIKGQGVFKDLFSLDTMSFGEYKRIDGAMRPNRGRPLFDDGIFLKLYHKTGDETYKAVFYEIADRLLEDEEPAGNWIKYGPCHKENGTIHPRHAYWWGLPMLMAYKDSGDKKYLDCAIRSGEWYIRAQRMDGGIIRNTYTNFNTDSFGHATSGAAGAAILWYELYQITGDERWLTPLAKAIKYCMHMQFTNAKDKNLNGAVLEKVMPPDGTDRSPYHLRDLGTIFFIQAASNIL